MGSTNTDLPYAQVLTSKNQFQPRSQAKILLNVATQSALVVVSATVALTLLVACDAPQAPAPTYATPRPISTTKPTPAIKLETESQVWALVMTNEELVLREYRSTLCEPNKPNDVVSQEYLRGLMEAVRTRFGDQINFAGISLTGDGFRDARVTYCSSTESTDVNSSNPERPMLDIEILSESVLWKLLLHSKNKEPGWICSYFNPSPSPNWFDDLMSDLHSEYGRVFNFGDWTLTEKEYRNVVQFNCPIEPTSANSKLDETSIREAFAWKQLLSNGKRIYHVNLTVRCEQYTTETHPMPKWFTSLNDSFRILLNVDQVQLTRQGYHTAMSQFCGILPTPRPTFKTEPTPTPTLIPIPTPEVVKTEPTPTPTLIPIPTPEVVKTEPTPTPTLIPIPTPEVVKTEPTPTPTLIPIPTPEVVKTEPTPTPTLIPIPTPEVVFVPLTEENLAKANSLAVLSNPNESLNGMFLSLDERRWVLWGLRDHAIGSFMHRCLDGTEYYPIRQQLELRQRVMGWNRLEYVRDASPWNFADHGNFEINFTPNVIWSIYRVGDSEWVYVEMGVMFDTCEPGLLARKRQIFDMTLMTLNKGGHFIKSNCTPSEIYHSCDPVSMWPVYNRSIIDPLTNSEIETGVIRCRQPSRIKCD